jgi:hypothetical protein
VTSTFFGKPCHAIELKKLAGRFRLELVSESHGNEKNREIEIIYFPNFRFDGSKAEFEALKFGDEFISIIKDSCGRSQLSGAKLDAKNLDLTSSLDAKESWDAISSQPNSYTRMLLKVTDQNKFDLGYTYKSATIPIGPHIDLLPRWKKTPNKVITLKRIK